MANHPLDGAADEMEGEGPDCRLNQSLDQVGIVHCQAYVAQIKHIFVKYQIPIVDDAGISKHRFVLVFKDGALQLLEPSQPRLKPIVVRLSRAQPLSRRMLLGRAVGRKVSTVVDATAGLGGDSMLLAKMGYHVASIERHPGISALLEDGIQRATQSYAHLKIEHCFGDAIQELAHLGDSPDVIFLDPMYPAGRKPSVKVARPIAVVKDLVGDDLDVQTLFDVAMQSASRRVVVKRPHFCEPLRPKQRTNCFAGKLVRYDVYEVR